MLYSTQTLHFARVFGIRRAVDMIIEAGFPAIDISIDLEGEAILDGDYVSLAKELRRRADDAGVRFIQAHAPFGGGYEYYLGRLVPKFPHAFELCSILGVENIVVHPLQQGRYYGNEERLFEMNMKFYSALAPLAKNSGVRIAIENMWQHHPVTHAICDDVCAPPEELCRYYDTLADPSTFTVCLDIGHVALCGREPDVAIRTIGRERLGCLHVHDNDYIADQHTLMYCGRINWDNVAHALGEIDYKGSLNLEADQFFAPFPTELLPDAMSFMHRVAKNLADKVDLYRIPVGE